MANERWSGCEVSVDEVQDFISGGDGQTRTTAWTATGDGAFAVDLAAAGDWRAASAAGGGAYTIVRAAFNLPTMITSGQRGGFLGTIDSSGIARYGIVAVYDTATTYTLSVHELYAGYPERVAHASGLSANTKYHLQFTRLSASPYTLTLNVYDSGGNVIGSEATGNGISPSGIQTGYLVGGAFEDASFVASGDMYVDDVLFFGAASIPAFTRPKVIEQSPTGDLPARDGWHSSDAGSNEYTMVDDAVLPHDSDTTYIYWNKDDGVAYQSFTYDASGIDEGTTIYGVVTRAYGKYAPGPVYLYLNCYIDASYIWDSMWVPISVYLQRLHWMPVKPGGGAWTPSDIDDANHGVYFLAGGSGAQARMTRLSRGICYDGGIEGPPPPSGRSWAQVIG